MAPTNPAVNARSLEPKLNHLHSLMKLINVDIDIIAVTETWETTLNEKYLAINNYKKVSKLITDGKKMRRVALLVKYNISFLFREDINSTTF